MNVIIKIMDSTHNLKPWTTGQMIRMVRNMRSVQKPKYNEGDKIYVKGVGECEVIYSTPLHCYVRYYYSEFHVNYEDIL